MIARILHNLRTPEPEPPPWSLLTAFVTLIAVLLALVIGTLIILSGMGDAPPAALLGWTLGSAVAVMYIWSSFRRSRPAFRLGPTNTRLFLVLLFAVGMAVLIDLIDLGVTGQFVPVPELMNLVGAEAGAGGWLAALLFMLAVQPVAEELAFRGVFLPVARARFGGWGGLLASALLYGLFHLIAYTTVTSHLWHSFITPALIGLVIGGVRADTGSTRAAIVAHMGFGIFALLKLLAVA